MTFSSSEALTSLVQSIPASDHAAPPLAADLYRGTGDWIESITDRILQSGRSLKELEGIFKNFSPCIPDILPWVVFSADGYKRNRIMLCDEFELLVLCWRSGQLTPIHDHSGSACVVKVLQGTATEISYERSACNLLVPTKTARLDCDSVTGSFDADIHQLGNLESTGEDLITLHCYSPPLLSMRPYESSETFFGGYDATLGQRLKRLDSVNAFQHETDQSGT